MPLEQLHAKLALQRVDVPGKGGLRDAQAVRCPADALQIADDGEVLQLAKVHALRLVAQKTPDKPKVTISILI